MSVPSAVNHSDPTGFVSAAVQSLKRAVRILKGDTELEEMIDRLEKRFDLD
ncbi:hypothetical protein CL65_gp099 [Mycobacterium phage Patience]|uniref:Uncharacterized protein n=2 Tax=Patiencevirus patience TaxID=1982360 RepID=A0A0K1LS30_9CAUD|nr:hypothetical protein CL65_gp099 [Mycobacterium phage Patience]AEL98007.1 hypothetical protein PATIENCE_99 [Mycobacterium phage Patience]AKU45386.1 hypothetical protein MADRUGA_97 [Mycobacterium phage Madruga]UOW93422.1 hypothetical protein SEA_LABELLE_98 [Mycobacterium phage Labelle]